MKNLLQRYWQKRSTRRRGQACPKLPPHLEGLEERLAPAVYTVTSNADAGADTLRAAIDASNASVGVADTIVFDLAAGQENIVAVLNDTTNPFDFGPTAFVITDALTIAGDPNEAGITISGNNSHRIFGVMTGASLTLQYVTVTAGKATGGKGGNSGPSGAGGGAAGLGGAIFNNGTLTIQNSTLTGSSAFGGDGGRGNFISSGSGGGGGAVGGNGGDTASGYAGGGGGVGGAGSNGTPPG